MTRNCQRLTVLVIVGIVCIVWLLGSIAALPMSGVLQGRLTWSTPMSATAKAAFVPWLATGLLFSLFHLLALFVLSRIAKRYSKFTLTDLIVVLATIAADFGLLYLCDALIAGFTIPSFSCALLTMGLIHAPFLIPLAISMAVTIVVLVVYLIVVGVMALLGH